mgnify:CR=1 FL=1
MIITANHTTSEVDITELSFRFFEGSVTVSGTIDGTSVSGNGFAELLHDYENPDVSLSSPIGGNFDTSMPITWVLNNPDDGRPVKYDLEYSIDNKLTFNSITTGLTNTSYLWDGSGLNNGDSIWFKIKAYSVDNTLISEVISAVSSMVTLDLNSFESKKIKTYPNPVKDNLYLDLPDDFNQGNVQILDLHGRVLHLELIDKPGLNHLNIEFLPNAAYLIKFESNEFMEVFKFIKK